MKAIKITTLLKPAFTILELIISIGIISIIATIVLLAVDPIGLFDDADTSSNEVNTQEMQKALQRYAVRFGEYPPGITSTSMPICTHGVTDASCIALHDELASDSNARKRFVAKIPQTDLYASPNSGYEVALNSNGVAIVALYTGPLITQGLVNHWKFNEGTGTIAEDTAGSNDGTFVNLTTANWSSTEPSTGLYENSFQGGPTNGYVSLNEPVSLEVSPTSQWTISYWYNQESGSDMSLGETGTNQNRIYQIGHYRVHLDNNQYIDITGFSPTSNQNNWYHFSLAWNGTTFDGYVNGVAKTYSSGSYGGGTTSFELDTIGHAYSNDLYTWLGKLSDVRIYNRALTGTEVLSINNGDG